jgi:hypothetical protein
MNKLNQININTNTYKIIILPVALFGHGAWSLTLKVEKNMGD